MLTIFIFPEVILLRLSTTITVVEVSLQGLANEAKT